MYNAKKTLQMSDAQPVAEGACVAIKHSSKDKYST